MSNSFEELFDKQFRKHKRKPQTDVPINPTQPNLESRPYPRIRSTRTKDDILYVAGNGCQRGGVMFVSPALIEEDAVRFRQGNFGKMLEETPAHMKCLSGQVLKDLAMECGIPEEECRFTSVVKWLLPKAKRLKPDTKSLKWAYPSFHDELKWVKPKVIVCLGKQVFDLICPVKYKADDIRAGWFYSEQYDCRYILLDPFYLLASRPDYVEKFRVNLHEVSNMYSVLQGNETQKIPTHYEYIETTEQLKEIVSRWRNENRKLFAVDCEWAGNNFIDGELRTIQFCWEVGKGCAVKFRNERREYVFDSTYEEAGAILGEYLNQPDVKYIGHHWSADSPWMHHVLKLDIWGKCILDTEFALQTCNEHADLSLERLALQYTDLGRYDLPLELWKKDNKLGHDDGYGYVPDDILLPYSIADCDVCMRVFPIVVKDLIQQELWDYYQNIFNPFVTDVFSNFTITGLPIDTEKLNSLRELFLYAKTEMEVEFRTMMVEEARSLVYQVCEELGGEEGRWVADAYMDSPPECSLDVLKSGLGVNNVARLIALDEHFKIAKEFNIRSGIHMRRWLFEVKNYEPVKSTNQKEKGFPSMAWEKVKGLPPDVRSNYLPAVDKQTLKIYSQKGDKVVGTLLDLNAVGNLLKGFLKPAELDDEGNPVRENGLHFWVASDGRVHYNSSVTETARNRCWKPNILNWPKFVTEAINRGVRTILELRHSQGALPVDLEYYLTHGVPSIRSIVKAPPGWLICESDYATAEVRGLAFLSGCPDLIRLVTQPDFSFGFWKKNKKVAVRLCYDENCGIPEDHQYDKYVMAVKVDGEWVKIPEDELLTDDNGEIVHPERADLHWSLAESLRGFPREMLNKDLDRDGAGKTGNFSCVWENACIITDSGSIPICNINTRHKVWDGVEFVRHEGLINKGKLITIEYQGLRATPDHVVWGTDGRPVCLIDALVGNLELVGSNSGEPVRLHLESPYSGESPEGLACYRRMQEVQSAFDKMVTQLEEGEVFTLQMLRQKEIQRPENYDVDLPLEVHAPEMQHGNSRIKSQIQGQRYSVEVYPERIRKVGAGNMARRDLLRERLRQDRQRRALRVLELTSSHSVGKSEEHGSSKEIPDDCCTSIPTKKPELYVQYYSCKESHPAGENGNTDIADARSSCESWVNGHQEGREKVTPVGSSGESIEGLSPGLVNRPNSSRDMGEEYCQREYAPSSTKSSSRGRSGRSTVSSLTVTTQTPGVEIQSGVFIRIVKKPQRGRNSPDVARLEKHFEGEGQEFCITVSRSVDLEQRGENVAKGCRQGTVDWEVLQETNAQVEMTYDLLNAGPRRRFVADGIVVSNCAYGAAPASIERKLEADTGVKPEEGTGQGILDALYSRQNRAMEWLDEQQEIPRNQDFTRLASGRKRRWLGTHSRSSMEPRAWDALMSAQGREARNTPLQESVASTSAIAAVRLLRFAQEHNLEGRPMVLLYDAVCTLCPEREALIWELAHELFMYHSVVWKYGDRYLNYPTDAEFNRGWSSAKMSEEEIAKLDIPEDLRHLEESLLRTIEWYKENMDKAVCNTHVIE